MKNVFHKDAIAQGNAAPKKMTKQQEIREWIEMHLRLAPVPLDDIESATTTLLAYLHSKGVVIKVDRELPGNIYKNHKMANALHVFHGTQQDMLCAGFASVEPLFDTKKGEG